MEQYRQIISQLEAMEKKHSEGQISKEYYDIIKSKYVETYPAQAGINAIYLKRYSEYASMNSGEIESASQNFQKMVSNSQNVELWLIYFDFLKSTNDQISLKKAFDQAIETVGLFNASSSPIWEKYIDHEIQSNRLANANLLSYMSIETPLKQSLLKKYSDLLYSNFEQVFESMISEEALSTVNDKFHPKFKSVVQALTDDCKGDKTSFISHIQIIDSKQNPERKQFEEKLIDESAWLKYINFELKNNEIKRAKILYERAIQSSLQMETNIDFWLMYTNFIQEHLKDATLVRAKFEQKLNDPILSTQNKIDVLIGSATFEEQQSNSPRARKIYEQLDQEIAPGLVKATMARINFEKRQGNSDRVRELYYKAFNNALDKNDGLAVTFIATHYARFLAYKCNDQVRALSIFNQAISNPACANKVLFLSFVGLARGLNLPDSSTKIKQIFEKAVSLLSTIPQSEQDKIRELQDVCLYYVSYLEEEANDGEQLREAKQTKQRLQEKGFLKPELSNTTLAKFNGQLGGLGRKRPASEGVHQLEAQV